MGMGEGMRLGAPLASRFLPKHTQDPGRDPWACSDLTTDWEEDVWGRGAGVGGLCTPLSTALSPAWPGVTCSGSPRPRRPNMQGVKRGRALALCRHPCRKSFPNSLCEHGTPPQLLLGLQVPKHRAMSVLLGVPCCLPRLGAASHLQATSRSQSLST